MIGEFPELQGYMGGVYARLDGENERVAEAITEHYRPAHAGDDLPESRIARAIAIAERADKLLGYFHLGRIPTSSADPFGLRRAAMGLIVLLADERMPVEMSLAQVLREAAKQWNQQRVTIAIADETLRQVEAFIAERLSIINVRKSAIEAAFAAAIDRPVYQHAAVARLLAGFADSEAGQAVAAANKRIANILKKTDIAIGEVNASLFTEEAERALFAALSGAERDFPDDPEAQLEVSRWTAFSMM
jgi:glycyl-tRNA synthetase beta chain